MKMLWSELLDGITCLVFVCIMT